MTIDEFKENSHIDGGLIDAVVGQFGDWGYFSENAQDIADHGADSGWPDFTYHAETCKFAEKNRKEILASLREFASQCGENLEDFILNFNCLKDYKMDLKETLGDFLYNGEVKEDDEFGNMLLNALAWYALEETARNLADLDDGGDRK